MKKLLTSAFIASAILTLSTACSSSNDTMDKTNPIPENSNELKGTYKKGQVLELDGSKTYKLSEKLIIEDGATLKIPAGTTIIGTGGTSSYIAIAQGGKIYIEGTKENPVVMTAQTKKRGSWGGLVICGKAPINKGVSATAEVSDLTYGGTQVDDSSGSIRFLRVEYAGAIYNAEKEFNGLSFFGVGNGTTIEYVQAHEGSDDGFEWFGGTVNTKYLVSTNNDDDQFDWTEGYSGSNEYWYSKQTGVADKGIEADNNSKNYTASPISFPKISHLTLVGSDTPAVDGKPKTALHFRVGTKAVLDNVYLKNFELGILVENDETLSNIGKDLLLTNVTFENVNTKQMLTNNDSKKVEISGLYTENTNNGAGNGAAAPDWTKGWTVGLDQ